jgi:hypothetical protein
LDIELSGPNVVSNSTNSPATVKLAQTWLRNCLDNHDRCNYDIEKYWRPTRLIELDQPSNGSVALSCWSHEMTTTEFKYVTLSHCWGYGDPLKLTSSTFSTLLKGVPVSKLPQTFQDAIVISRHLGLKFIWIDSLCIFQDSREDWVYESSLMGKVYSQALCNIGATASSTGDQGCFRQRNPLLLERTVVESSWTNHSNAKYYIHADHTAQQREIFSPLLLRGWVVQEHVLSRRFLHFGAQQLFFECRQGYASEMYPEGESPGMDWLTEPLQKAAEPRGLVYHDSNSVVDAENLYNFWARLVEYYSRCSLTVESDKLIAISGIAKILQRGLGDKYVAGMWKRSLPRCLLWRLEARESKGTVLPPKSCLAPTWSWASVKGMVEFPSWYPSEIQIAEICVEVVQTEVITASSDPTGEILSGFIKLRGMLKTVVLQPDSNGCYYANIKSIVDDNSNESCPFPDIYMDGTVATSGTKNVINLHLMPITYDPYYFLLKGLLLAPTGRRAGQFHRVGVLYCDFWQVHCKHLGEPVTLDVLKSVENYDWVEYEEFDGVDKYTITIV